MSQSSPGEKAGPLKYSSNHVYNIADCLGKGATASVYLGRNRTTGAQVAIKVFTSPETYHITQSRIRETDLLRNVSHRNVMRLLATEQEVGNGNHLLIMPYCQSGSVYALLEQPQNGFGFQEKEFLWFLDDITQGLQYLNQRKIIHRDIKPGNIMKAIEDDGRSVFILTDFGAARELDEDEETFKSIYGTEEYIHPNMFQRAVLRQPGPNKFDSSVDLWSLAVTIYHVATGTLPFLSFGGRNDSQTTFEIMSGRKSGEISGIQRKQGGPIERSRRLPETCYLSSGLRRLLEPILAGLFEPDYKRAMSFDQYFKAVNDIVDRKTLKVFYAQNCLDLVLYLRQRESFVHLQEEIAALTDIPADRQIILLDHTELKDIIGHNDPIQTYPKSVQNAQLILFEKDNYEVRPTAVLFSLPPFPPLPVEFSLSSDNSVAKKRAAIAYFLEWKTSQVLRSQELLLHSKLVLRLYVEHLVRPITTMLPEFDKELGLAKKAIECLQQSQRNVQMFMTLIEAVSSRSAESFLEKAVKQFSTMDNYVEDVFHKTYTRCEEIKVYTSVLVQKLTECSTPCPTDHMGCQPEDHCLTKIEHVRQGIQTVATTFAKHKKYGELHPHEKFIHKVEREKLEDLSVKILSLFQGHCLANLVAVHTSVNKQNSIVLKHLTRVGKVETNIKCVNECLAQVNGKLNQLLERYKNVSTLLNAQAKTLLENPSMFFMRPKSDTQTGQVEESFETSASSARDEKDVLMQTLLDELTQLGTARAELDGMLSSNTSSLLELRRMLENASRLSPTSFASDSRSVERTERLGYSSASGWSATSS